MQGFVYTAQPAFRSLFSSCAFGRRNVTGILCCYLMWSVALVFGAHVRPHAFSMVLPHLAGGGLYNIRVKCIVGHEWRLHPYR